MEGGTPCSASDVAPEGTGTGWNFMALVQPVPIHRTSRDYRGSGVSIHHQPCLVDDGCYSLPHPGSRGPLSAPPLTRGMWATTNIVDGGWMGGGDKG